jgi:NADPH-dependent 2,4-dienoyl-CoA reductase/sulfur reductase-like enzyme
MSVAAKARRVNKDADIIVIEKEDYVSFGACGLPYYLGGQFDDPANMFARTPEQIRAAGIELYLKHEVTNVDFDEQIIRVTNLTSGQSYEMDYDRLMIATGALPIVPPIAGLGADNMYTITRLAETERLKQALPEYQRIAVIGGGFIGLEVADQLAALGKEVHIFEREEHVMSRVFDDDILEKVESAIIEERIKLHLSEGLESVTNENGKITELRTNRETYAFDALVVSIGFKPNTQLFADTALKKIENGAIIIDKYGRTSVPNVFSAGDCASVPDELLGDMYLPFATSANKIGRLIGINIVSDEKDYEAYPGSLRSSELKLGRYEAGGTGLSEKQAKALDLSYKSVVVETNNHTSYYPGQSKVTIKLVYEQDTYKLLGAQVFGQDGAVLRLLGLTTAIYAGLSTKELGFIDYAYAPPFASTWEALNVAGNAAK